MRILWCITGAGHLLQECVEVIEKSQDEVTVALSSAGEEVARTYGLFDRIKKVAVETILESEQGSSYPVSGRMAKKEYDVLVVAPCTANTVAKTVHGIADSLASNLVAQAQKSEIPIVILPTDFEESQKTKIPVTIEFEKCQNCEPCPAMEACPNLAFYRAERLRINLLKCNACRKCILLCEHGAVTFGKEVTIKSREIDLKNLSDLKKIQGIKAVRNPEELYSL
ncbi:MAG: hypothetical protein L6243_06400 [Candidatus Altiarchaeales archaeon]|nr:hypothetical protein [Candidatus Altiarchaeota archaeon]MCG2783201.1 hypothetical protein [Candidatus Altiarchaeales archaeon]MBU4266670.1 hypothetical protein [Candidatus Altiarchaeota archaeon]MBU4342056.1 hypothetical protein [Candidatus Altiarchaeota archaeon]MBU4406695.1 hypothetical protein [Candidatus Altiarchaeota archaeon]